MLALLLAALVTPGAARREGLSTSSGIDYFALGDSVASGNAADDRDRAPCLRGDESYPAFVRVGLAEQHEAVHFVHLACSGGRVAAPEEELLRDCRLRLGLLADEAQEEQCAFRSLRRQVDETLARLTGRETLVTITAGVNDTGWSDPLSMTRLMLAPDDELQAEIERIVGAIERSLAAQVERLLAHPRVTVVLTGYYNPFNAESSLYRLIDGARNLAWLGGEQGNEPCTGIDGDNVRHELACAERIEHGLLALDAALARIAAAHPRRVLFAPLAGDFQGHESPHGLCGAAEPSSGESWIRETAGQDEASRLPDCFHPNEAGARAIADAVLAALP